NDVYLDQVYVILAARGQMNDWFKWQIAVNGNAPKNAGIGMAQPAYPSIGIQDAIIKVEPDELFNIWMGRFIVPFDRANLSGPWFINYNLFPGFFGNRAGAPIGARAQGPNGRDQGVVVWGQYGKGMFKYYLAAQDLDTQVHASYPLL